MKGKAFPVVANHHERNAILKRANKTIRENLECRASARPRPLLVDLVTLATFYEISTCDHNEPYLFDLLFNRSPKLSTACKLFKHGTIKEHVANGCCRQLEAEMHAKIRASLTIKIGDYMYFWSNSFGWIGLELVVNLKKDLEKVWLEEIFKTAAAQIV